MRAWWGRLRTLSSGHLQESFHLTEKQNSYLQTEFSDLLQEVVSYEEWPPWESRLCNVKPLSNNIIYSLNGHDFNYLKKRSHRSQNILFHLHFILSKFLGKQLLHTTSILHHFTVMRKNNNKNISHKDVINLYNISYWPSMRPRWLDIGQVFFGIFMAWDKVKVNKNAKKKTLRQYEAFLAEPAF